MFRRPDVQTGVLSSVHPSLCTSSLKCGQNCKFRLRARDLVNLLLDELVQQIFQKEGSCQVKLILNLMVERRRRKKEQEQAFISCLLHLLSGVQREQSCRIIISL